MRYFILLILICLSRIIGFKLNMVDKKILQEYKPLSKNQDIYKKALEERSKKIILATGSSGTGKTLFATCLGVDKLNKKHYEKIIITMPLLKNVKEKNRLLENYNDLINPLVKHIFDIFYEYYDYIDIEKKLRDNIIETIPLEYMRGRTFKNAYIIADEMQNCNNKEFKLLLTRLGENSKLIIIGDLEQKDIKYKSGLEIFIEKLENYKREREIIEIDHIKFNKNDIFKSTLIKNILEIYNFDLKSNKINKNKEENKINKNKEENNNKKEKINDVISGSELISKKDYEILKKINGEYMN